MSPLTPFLGPDKVLFLSLPLLSPPDPVSAPASHSRKDAENQTWSRIPSSHSRVRASLSKGSGQGRVNQVGTTCA